MRPASPRACLGIIIRRHREGIMAIKDILLHLDASPRSTARLDIALRLAAAHEAHLTALHVIELPPAAAFNGYPTGLIDVERVENMLADLRATRVAEAAEVEAGFRAGLIREGISGEWRVSEGEAGPIVALHGRYADLIVLGQGEPAGGPNRLAADIPVTDLMEAGRPMLVVPYAGSFPTLGRHALVGWNGSAEAARAINAAIPLLARAARVTVLSINPRRGLAGDGDLPAVDMALHLARHGIRAEAAHSVAPDIGEGDALLSYASDVGADLLVCGMYGHSRLRQQMFGGVTRSLLTEMTLPVFMSH
jgi:nucleotide-binding universal stress UspA family protein